MLSSAIRRSLPRFLSRYIRFQATGVVLIKNVEPSGAGALTLDRWALSPSAQQVKEKRKTLSLSRLIFAWFKPRPDPSDEVDHRPLKQAMFSPWDGPTSTLSFYDTSMWAAHHLFPSTQIAIRHEHGYKCMGCDDCFPSRPVAPLQHLRSKPRAASQHPPSLPCTTLQHLPLPPRAAAVVQCVVASVVATKSWIAAFDDVAMKHCQGVGAMLKQRRACWCWDVASLCSAEASSGPPVLGYCIAGAAMKHHNGASPVLWWSIHRSVGTSMALQGSLTGSMMEHRRVTRTSPMPWWSMRRTDRTSTMLQGSITGAMMEHH